jgi:DNA-binding transcriptional LysR family regulator
MEIKQLITFKHAAENLNFTQTAKLLNFAQSSVTAQIKALEDEIGKPLFERLGKRLILTEAGRTFKSYADKIIALSQEAVTAANGEEEISGTLTIGAQESQCTYRLPLILKEFKSAFPKVKLVFKPAHSDEIARKQLMEGLFVNADLILTHHRRFRIDPPGDFCWLGRRGGAVGSSPHFFTESVTVPPNIDDVGMV